MGPLNFDPSINGEQDNTAAMTAKWTWNIDSVKSIVCDTNTGTKSAYLLLDGGVPPADKPQKWDRWPPCQEIKIFD